MATTEAVSTDTVTLVHQQAIQLQRAAKPRRIPNWGWALIAGAVLWLLAYLIWGGQANLPLAPSELTEVHRALNDANTWVGENRGSNGVLLALDQLRVVVGAVVAFFLGLLSESTYGLGYPEIGWLGVVALFTWIAWFAGNGRVAVLTAVCFTAIGFQGLFTEAMATLALTLAAVLFALLIGIPLGIWMGVDKRVSRVVTPVLDFMQTMPTFVYLTPLALIFLIGPASAVIATLIYAAPPVIRLTAHGVRDIPAGITEAVDSLGVTGRQRMRTVVLPLARKSIVIGINQTMMSALSMATIAALIAAPGLGQVVVQALQSLNVGAAFNGGLAIVLMAIVLDRVTTAASNRADPQFRAKNAGANRARRRIVAAATFVLVIVAVYLSRTMLPAAVFPSELSIGAGVVNAVNDASDWLRTSLYALTIAVKDGFTVAVLNPLQELLTQTPFVVIVALLLLVAWLAGRLRAAALTAVCLAVILFLGLWADALVTLTSTLIATVATVLLGLVIGVWMGRSARADALIRPLLDAAQTMPAFVYLVPFLGLFGPSRFTAIVAAVIYAAPVAIKIIAEGIRGVPENTVEAAVSSGASPWQVISKVQLPMAKSSITLAVNQGLIYVLSMVVIGGLVGGGGLGYDVVAGFVQGNLFGKGLAAGITIVLLGILLDGITQAAARTTPARPLAGQIRRDRSGLLRRRAT
jgi:glycine betaine/proline transport system permease protein